ncbi:beta strand repeat-containing protein, partial [Sphingorhabdus rigui]|uniref:beta strand repeat-containing protein n=1 Tax=Sphingorhabdus rigui TaxID=1282858 RepID=UPI002ADDF9EA
MTITATDATGATGSEAYSIFIGAPSAPSLTSISVREGPVSGGTVVVLTGTDFLGATGVTFGSYAATNFTVNSNTQITVTTPAAAASGFGQVVVTTPWGSSESTGQSRIYVYLGQPTVTSVTPATGSTLGGTSVVLRGDNLFGTSISVTVGGVAATNVIAGSGPTAGELRITTPANVPGTANIVVTTPGGITPTSPANEFAYVPPPPQVNSLSVYSGPVAGGTVVTITGNFLTGPTQVTFGGVSATSINVVNDTTITATTPAGTAGQVDMVVTTLGGSITQSGIFEYIGPPAITSISPNTGGTSGNTYVTINGTGFQNATSVTFGGVPALSYNVFISRIEAVSPPGASGTVDVVVTTPAGSSATGSATQFTYANPQPQIFSVGPGTGSTAGGNRVSINGQNLTGVTSVTFGGVPALYFTVSNPSNIVAYAPAGSLGTVSVAVTSPSGTATASNAYTYVDPAAVTITGLTSGQGPLAGGNEVGIVGTNFTGATAVTFGGTAVTSFTVVSATRILAVVPAASSTGPVSVVVTAPGGTATRAGAYNYVALSSAPTISSVSPSNISVDGGSVTVFGTNFIGVTSVTFNGVPGTSMIDQGGTVLTITAPAGTVGPVDIAVTTAAGTATRVNAATYIADRLPAISAVSPASGPNSGGTTVTITGTNFSSATAVRFGSGTGTSFSVVSPTQITVVTPVLSDIGTQGVTIASPAGSSISNVNSRFVFTSSSLAAPTISSVSPNNGAIAGGTSVTITGTNFSGTASVRFGTEAATSFIVNSATQITAVTPAGSAGAVDISVTALGGTVTSNGAFTYSAPQQQPASQSISFTSTAPSGAVVGGATYTPTATATSGLSVALSVDASSSATCSIAGGVVSFTGAGTCRINADQAGDSSFAAASQVQQSFSVLPAAPTITAVTPNSGTTAGGTSVVITGTDLTGATVNFGSTAATSVVVNSATQVTAVSPAGSAGAAD